MVLGLRGQMSILSEAYAYAYTQTVARTAHTLNGIQHPSYEAV